MKDYTPRSIVDQISKHPAFDQLDDRVKRGASVVATHCLTGVLPHKLDDLAAACSSRYLRMFGVTVKEIIDTGIFCSMDAAPGYCTGWLLTPEILLDLKPIQDGEIDVKTGHTRRRPTGAVQRNGKTGTKVARVDRIEAVQRIDIDALKVLLGETDNQYVKNSVTALISSADATGQVFQTYWQHHSGRLFGIGTHLQTVPKIVRRVALGGSELDLKNCHPTIIYHLATRVGIPVPTVERYVNDPHAFRQQLAEELNVDVGAVKTMLLAATYGGQKSFSIAEEMRKAGGDVALLKKCQVLTGYIKDITQAGKDIVAASPTARNGALLVNAIGSGMLFKGSKQSQLLSHILQGIERQALDAMVSATEQVLCLEHDGVTTADPYVDLEEIEAAVLEATGIPFVVGVKS